MVQFAYLKILLGSSPGAIRSLISQKILIEQGRDAYEGRILDSQLCILIVKVSFNKQEIDS